MLKIKLGQVCISRVKCRRLPLGPNARLHWRERHKWNGAWAEEVFWKIRENYPQLTKMGMPFDRAIIYLTIYATHPPDLDNAVAACKPIVDGLKGIVIKDDSYDKCEIRVKVEKVRHKKDEHVEIEVEKLSSKFSGSVA